MLSGKDFTLSPNDKSSDCSELKAFADHRINVTWKLKFGLGSIKNILGKGENAGNQHFLLFPNVFSTASVLSVVKNQDCAVNSLPFTKRQTLDRTKLKPFAEEKLNIINIIISLLHTVENTVGKGENAGYQHFLLFPQCFPKPSSLGLLKVHIAW